MKYEFWKPHTYQQKGIDFCLDNFKREGSSAFFLPPGMGKTSCSLELFRILKEQGNVQKALIVAPLRVAQSVWPTELQKWLNFVGMTYALLHGPDKDREALRNVDIYIINYEGLLWLLSKPKFWKIDMLIFDELTRMKSWKSQRVKAIKPFLSTFKYRLGLTGTPAPNGLEDLFSQTYMLDSGLRFGRAKTRFEVMYFYESTYTGKLQLLPGAKESIFKKLENLAYSLDADDHLQLPKEIFNNIYVDLPATLLKQYETLKKEAIVALENEVVITAHTAGVLTTKLRQFLSGNIYVNGKIEHIHNIKYDYLKEFVEDTTEPVLIGYQYRHEAEQLLKTIPYAVPIGSGTPIKQLNTIITKWNRGEIPVLIGHPQSIGHGLNLQGGGATILFFSLDFNLENYLQFIKRLSRQGQTAPHVYIHHLVVRGTIDEYLLAVLHSKDSLQTNLLQFLKK